LTSTVVAAASQLAVGVILARLLTPAEFGVVALSIVLLGLALPLSDLGMAAAVVQRAELTDRHVRTAFTFSAITSMAAAIVVSIAAPLGAVVTRDPQVTAVLRVLAVGVACRGIAAVAEALLHRQLDFRRLFFIESISHVLGYGGVAVTLALLGYGSWSLVWGSLVQTIGASVAQLAVVRHSLRPLVGRRPLADLVRFGFGEATSGWVNYIALNGDNFVVGRWMGVTSLGLYSRAYALMNLPFTYAARVMSSVMFPALAHVQQQPDRMRRGYLLLTEVVATIAAPCLGILAIAAPHLVPSVYGVQWTGAVVPLQILCLAGYFRVLYHLGSIVAKSAGRVYNELWRQVIYAALVISGTLAGSRYGLPGVTVGVGIAILYMFVASTHLAIVTTGTSWRAYVQVQRGALRIAAATCSIALAIRIVLEASHAPSAVIALAVVAGALVPWSIGVLRYLGQPAYEPFWASLPGPCLRLLGALRGAVRV
jgi:PST family polysaccharide transporter